MILYVLEMISAYTIKIHIITTRGLHTAMQYISVEVFHHHTYYLNKFFFFFPYNLIYYIMKSCDK